MPGGIPLIEEIQVLDDASLSIVQREPKLYAMTVKGNHPKK